MPVRGTIGRAALFGVVIALVVTAVILGQALTIVAIAVIIPLVAAIYYRPQRAFLLFAALAPFNGLLLLINTPGFAKGWKEALVGLSLVATFVCPMSARGPRGRRLPQWLPALCGLLVLGLLSALTISGQQALLGLKVNFFYVLLALAVWRAPLDGRERDRLVSIFMIVGFVCSIIGLLQQVVGSVALHNLGYQYNSTIRFSGGFLRSFSTFDQPFPFALYVMLVLLIGIPVALENPNRLRNKLFLWATPVYLLGVLSAFVRSAWLGLAIGLLYLGVRRYRVVLALIPLAFVPFLLVAGPVTSTLLSSSSLQARTQGWGGALPQIQMHPLGVGIGSAGVVAERLATPTSHGYQPDNYFFKTLYELGPLGLWMLVLLLVGIFAATRLGSMRAAESDRGLLEGMAAVVLASMVVGLIASYFEIFPIDMTFWLLVGLAATMTEPVRRSQAESEEVDLTGPPFDAGNLHESI